MARRKSLQTNFSAGEIAPELAMRQDTEQYRNGAKSLLNMRCLIGGGVTRRPGLRWLQELTSAAIPVDFIVNQTTKYILCFADARVDAFLPNGTAAGSITGCPWDATNFDKMDWVQSGNTMFLVHPSMPIQKIVRTGPATWTRTAFTFFGGIGGRTEQPYYKVADAAMTLAPSALTGAITLTASGVLFGNGHIGQKIRYLGREVLITSVVIGGLVANGTVVQTLPATQTLTVTSSAKFGVGEVVLGDTSEAKGQVTGIPDATHLTVVIIHGLTEFVAEDVIGPNAVTAISAVAAATPAAVVDFDEQLIGSVYGYPSVVKLHRNRLIFAGHTALPNALISSRLGNLYSFDVGDGSDADAIFETIGDAGASEIRQLYSAEQLLIATDHGLYYVPESQTNPFRPTSMAFFPFGSPWVISSVAKARSFDDGVLFVSDSLIIMARPTGNLTQSWEATEVSLLSSHIIDSPTNLAVSSNFNGSPERYAFIRNVDGSLAVLQLVAQQKIRNVTPWQLQGAVVSVAALQGTVYVVTLRHINNLNRYFLEVYEEGLTLDMARTLTNLTDIATYYGATIPAPKVVVGNYSLGTYPLAVDTPPAGPYTVGFDYTTRVEPLPPAVEDEAGPIAGELIRITDCYVTVISSARFAQNGFELAAYQVTDDITIAPPLRTGAQRFQFQGWSVDPTVVVTQPDPLPLTVIAMKTVVAF